MTRSVTAPPLRHSFDATTPLVGDQLLVVLLRAVEEHVLLVIGEADVKTADQLRRHLIDALAEQPPALRVDLDALDFCDLSGLDALHDAARRAAEAGVHVTFTGVSTQLAWLHQTFPSSRCPSPVQCTWEPAEHPDRLGAGRQGPEVLAREAARATHSADRRGDVQDASNGSIGIAGSLGPAR